MTDTTLNTAATGLKAADASFEGVVQNISSAKVPGYKEVNVPFRAFGDVLEEAQVNLLNAQTPGVALAAPYSKLEEGALVVSHNYTDVAISGSGFLALKTPAGVVYTRDGRFQVTAEGQLLSLSGGFPVLGPNGPITVSSGQSFIVTEEGDIVQDGTTVGRLEIVDFKDPKKLVNNNGVFFTAPEEAGPRLAETGQYRLIQGYYEASNTDLTTQMVQMIVLSRMTEANSKVIQARDAALSLAIQMGKPGQ